MTHQQFDRLEALLRTVDFPVYDVADDQSCGQPRSVTLVRHGTDVSVRIRHMGEPADYRECWRFVDSREVHLEHPLRRACGPYRALREAVRWRYLAPRLLGEPVLADPKARRRSAEADVVIEEVDVLVDGKGQRGLMAQDGSAFGCYLLLSETKVSISGCHPPERLSLVRADKQDLLKMPRAWRAPDRS